LNQSFLQIAFGELSENQVQKRKFWVKKFAEGMGGKFFDRQHLVFMDNNTIANHLFLAVVH
jgi:hypothetical protein